MNRFFILSFLGALRLHVYAMESKSDNPRGFNWLYTKYDDILYKKERKIKDKQKRENSNKNIPLKSLLKYFHYFVCFDGFILNLTSIGYR